MLLSLLIRKTFLDKDYMHSSDINALHRYNNALHRYNTLNSSSDHDAVRVEFKPK